MTENAETHIKALYESVGRGFESLPSHQEKPEHVCVLVFLFVYMMKGNRTGRRRIAPQAKPQCNDDDRCLWQKQGGVVGAAF